MHHSSNSFWSVSSVVTCPGHAAAMHPMRLVSIPQGLWMTLAFVLWMMAMPGVATAADGQRGRPRINAARTTFVADNGQLLRGPYESTEWTGAAPPEEVRRMRDLGFNAVHLYAESFHPRHPEPGIKPPGYAVKEVDQFVEMTRQSGLYLVITIGNGAFNGQFNQRWIIDFWKFYAPRYAKETHVLYEVQNEPVAWGPPYSSPKATPPNAVAMEVEAYKTIRAAAPETPILLFSYSVFGENGGKEALKDLAAFNAGVGGDPAAIWRNAAIAFHGYAGHINTPRAVTDVLAAGYPLVMTEFIGPIWGGEEGQDIELTATLERLGISWFNFLTIPPVGVSPLVTSPDAFKERVEQSGLSWKPDFGTWPMPRTVFGNGGLPRETPHSWDKDRLTGNLRIEAEDFDTGGQGVAYHDRTPAINDGRGHRPQEGVDIRPVSDGSAGFAVRVDDEEWLEYTIHVKEPGHHHLAVRYTATKPGTARFLLGGREFAQVPLASTGGAWRTTGQEVFLAYGQRILRLEAPRGHGGFDVNWIELTPAQKGPVESGEYTIVNQASGLVMTNLVGTKGCQVVQTPFADQKTQRWKLEHLGAGQYRISSLENKWFWSRGGGHRGGVNLFWWGGQNTGPHQRVVIRNAGDGVMRIAPVEVGHDLGVKDASIRDGEVLAQQPYKGEAHHHWAIQKPDAIGIPAGVAAERVSASQVTVTWNPVPGAVAYVVKRSQVSGGPSVPTRVPATATTFTDRSAANGQEAFYVVAAVGKTGEGLGSMAVSPGRRHAHLTFDEVTGDAVIDGVGRRWNGTLVGSPQRCAGIMGQAIELNGRNQHVTLPEGVMSGLKDFSITAWVHLAEPVGWARLFDFGNGPHSCMYLALYRNNGGSMRFAIRHGGQERDVVSSQAVPIGEWAHVAVTARSGTGTLFLNGDAVGQTSDLAITPDDLGRTTRNYLGKSLHPDPLLKGRVDDVRIYASALDPGEIALLARRSPRGRLGGQGLNPPEQVRR